MSAKEKKAAAAKAAKAKAAAAKAAANAPAKAPEMQLQVAFDTIQSMKKAYVGNEAQHQGCATAIETVGYHLNQGAEAVKLQAGLTAQVKALTEQNAELTAAAGKGKRAKALDS